MQYIILNSYVSNIILTGVQVADVVNFVSDIKLGCQSDQITLLSKIKSRYWHSESLLVIALQMWMYAKPLIYKQ
jgi:hypothetical protein